MDRVIPPRIYLNRHANRASSARSGCRFAGVAEARRRLRSAGRTRHALSHDRGHGHLCLGGRFWRLDGRRRLVGRLQRRRGRDVLRQGYEHGINLLRHRRHLRQRPRRDDPRAGLPRRRSRQGRDRHQVRLRLGVADRKRREGPPGGPALLRAGLPAARARRLVAPPRHGPHRLLAAAQRAHGAPGARRHLELPRARAPRGQGAQRGSGARSGDRLARGRACTPSPSGASRSCT